jgi:hypothetical protein
VRITKVVVFRTTNPTKLILQFFVFSTILYTIYKFQPKGYTIEVTVLRWGPWKFLQIYNQALTLHKTPQKNHEPCNVVQGQWPAAVRARAGIDPRVIGGRFRGSVVEGEGRRGGVLAASGGGRRDRCTGEVGLCGGRRARRRARVGAREGGSELGLGVQPAGARASRGCLHWHWRRPSVCTGAAGGQAL